MNFFATRAVGDPTANNNFLNLSGGIALEYCGMAIDGYSQNEILNNNLEAAYGITCRNPLALSLNNRIRGARTRVQQNTITASNMGIQIIDYENCDYPSEYIFVNDNNIQMTTPGTSAFRNGIYLNNSDCVTLGGNIITLAAHTPPSKFPNASLIGINILDSKNAKVSQGQIQNFDFGLVMDNDNGNTEYSCITFNTCHTSVMYKNITANGVQPVKDFNSQNNTGNASGNVFLNGTSSLWDIDAANMTMNGVATYKYLSGVTNQNPLLSNYASNNVLQKQFYATAAQCNPLPSQKGETLANIIAQNKFILFPNPSTNGSFSLKMADNASRATGKIYSLTGQLISEFDICYELTEVKTKLISGVYIVIVQLGEITLYEKLVVSGY